MRNLQKYLITSNEIIDCLRRLANDINKEERIGDMRPLILEIAYFTTEAIQDMERG